jgi:hypothetical protein
MARKKFTTEQIIVILRQVEVQCSEGKKLEEAVIRKISIETYNCIINMAGGLIYVTDNLDLESLKNDFKTAIDKYGISQQGLQAIDDYKIERLNKIKLPFAAIVIALGSLIVAIIALILAA